MNTELFQFAHILCELSKPKIVLTDNKSIRRLFKTKVFPPPLWNACEYVLQFNFQIAHIAGSVKTAADSLSRLEMEVTEEIRFKIREDVQTKPIEVKTTSSDVADEEQFFFTQTDGEDDIEEQAFGRKEQSHKIAIEWVANEEPTSMKPIVKEFTKPTETPRRTSKNGIKANERIRVKQTVDPVLKNLKHNILGQPFDEVLPTVDRQVYAQQNK